MYTQETLWDQCFKLNLKTDFVNARKQLAEDIVHHQLNGQDKVHISMFLLGTHNLDGISGKGQ